MKPIKVYFDPIPGNIDALPGKGRIPAEYAIVGTAPSPNRPASRYNEVIGARSWKLLEHIMMKVPGSIYVTTLSKIPYSFGKKLPKQLRDESYSVLLKELSIVRPRRILVLGAEPAELLCPGFTKMKDDHGTIFLNPELEKYIGHQVACVPTFPFAAVGRNPPLRKQLLRDIERFFTLPDPIEPYYVTIDERSCPDPIHFLDQNLYQGEVFCDIETYGVEDGDALDPRKGHISKIGLKMKKWDGPIIIQHPSDQFIRALYRLFQKHRVTLVGHHLQFDLYFLTQKSGIFWNIDVRDTMLMAHTRGEESLGLKHLTSMRTSRPGPHAFGSFQDDAYASEDVLSTEALYDSLLEERPIQYADILQHRGVVQVVAQRMRGVYIDRERLKQLEHHYQPLIEESLAKLAEYAGSDKINWNSNDQIVDILLRSGIELTEKTPTGKYSITEAVLRDLPQSPIIEELLRYRENRKILDDFIRGYLDMTTDDYPYLHPRLLIHGTRTGRMSMQDPNLQQVPRSGPIKTVFVSRFGRINNDCPPGKYFLVDLAQAELRVAALLSGDEAFAEILLAEDPHRLNASKIYKKPESEVTPAERKKSKGVTFGLLYGGSARGLAKRVGCTIDEVEEIINGFFGNFPRLAKWIERTKSQAIRDGRVETIFGRVRDLSDLIELNGVRDAERKAVNTPIQSVASDISFDIMVYVSEQVRIQGLKSRTLFPVHDSTIGEVYPGEEELIAEIVQAGFEHLNHSPLSKLKLWGKLPIVGEVIIGQSWAHVESTNEAYDPVNNRVFPVSSHPNIDFSGGRNHGK